MIRAIETRYKGYRFRSRLEARWAVFFDALQVQFEYEKEGYTFDGQKYLPDFWFPQARCWLEIKPTWDAVRAEESKLKKFDAAIPPDHRFAILCGSPWLPDSCLPSYDLVNFGSSYGALVFSGDKLRSFGRQFCCCPLCGGIDLYAPRQRSATEFSVDCGSCDSGPRPVPYQFASWFDKGECWTNNRSRIWPDELIAAYHAARSARFEHGESGAPCATECRMCDGTGTAWQCDACGEFLASCLCAPGSKADGERSYIQPATCPICDGTGVIRKRPKSRT